MKNISSPNFGVKMLPSPNVGTWKNFQSWDLEKFFHVQMLGLGKIFGLGLEKIFTSENSSKSQPENSSKTQHLDLGREKIFPSPKFENYSKSQHLDLATFSPQNLDLRYFSSKNKKFAKSQHFLVIGLEILFTRV
jgi:hypothetical protein